MKKFIDAANKALEQKKLVRIRTDYVNGTTILVADDVPIMTLQDVIVYPGFINCTKAGTPCRIEKATEGLGFGSYHARNWKDYNLTISNEYNSFDYEEYGEIDSYYGSDKYFEDGYEAGYCC